jgi:lysophospholipase L1-like esterase
VATIQSYTNNYNISIAGIASKYNLALVNINSYFNTFVSGIKYNGINMNAKFISGGAFSLDGVHPNARGYALLANEFIKSINAKYNSTIPQVDVTKYKGIIFP